MDHTVHVTTFSRKVCIVYLNEMNNFVYLIYIYIYKRKKGLVNNIINKYVYIYIYYGDMKY